MPTYTTRLGLTKPSGSASPAEAVNVALLNANADRIDETQGVILVNDGVTPADGDLFDGAVVREKTSLKQWVARTNGSGGFTKDYSHYPYMLYASAATNNYAISDTTFRNWGWGTYYGGTELAKNSSAGDINGSGFWVCPLKGIYFVKVRNVWATNTAGARGSQIMINGAADAANSAQTLNGMTSGPTALDLTMWRSFSAGDIVSNQLWQSSGGALNLDSSITVTMITPLV